MRIKSAVMPKRIEILETKDRFSTIALRRNVNSIIEEDSLMGEDIQLYEYDEVKVRARHRKNLIDNIDKNFNAWFTKGLELERIEKEIETKQKETKQLVNEYKQVDINNELSANADTLFEGVAETFEEVMTIDTIALTTLEGVSEVYELLDELIFQLEGGK